MFQSAIERCRTVFLSFFGTRQDGVAVAFDTSLRFSKHFAWGALPAIQRGTPPLHRKTTYSAMTDLRIKHWRIK